MVRPLVRGRGDRTDSPRNGNVGRSLGGGVRSSGGGDSRVGHGRDARGRLWDDRGHAHAGSWPVLGTDEGLELGDFLARDVEVPLEVAAHLALHLVDLLKLEQFLSDDAPRLVRVGVVADDL